MKMVPVLAESYEASKDGLVYTVKLRKGVKFHDGTDFNAEAVKVNLDRVTNPDNKLKRYGLYNDNIAKTEAVDDYTVRFTLKTAFSPFIAQLAHPSTVMISPAALKQWGNKDIAFHPVGTGPFQFVEWKATDYLKVAKFDGYWRQGYPRVDSITWKPVVDNNSRAALMQTGEAHFTYPVPYEVAEVLKAKPDIEVVAAPSIVLRYLSMNTQQKPFDNPKVRQAIAYAINKDALAKVAFNGYAAPAEGVAPQGVGFAVKMGAWLYYVGWSTATGEADWALRPLLYGESWPPKLFNTAYYKNAKVDADSKGAQLTTDRAEKAKLYKDAQETIWKDAPWAP